MNATLRLRRVESKVVVVGGAISCDWEHPSANVEPIEIRNAVANGRHSLLMAKCVWDAQRTLYGMIWYSTSLQNGGDYMHNDWKRVIPNAFMFTL